MSEDRAPMTEKQMLLILIESHAHLMASVHALIQDSTGENRAEAITELQEAAAKMMTILKEYRKDNEES